MRHRNIEVGKIYELKVRVFTYQMWDANMNPIVSKPFFQILGWDKNKNSKVIAIQEPYQTALVLEKSGKRQVLMRCMVGTDDIWLNENAFDQELTKKRARQLARSQQKENQ